MLLIFNVLLLVRICNPCNHYFHIKKHPNNCLKFSDANIRNENKKGVPFQANIVPFQALVDFQRVTGILQKFRP